MKPPVIFRSLLALFLALASVAMASTTWYVDGVNGNDNNNCKSPQHACKTIGHAISLASPGDSVRVAPATYTENLTIGFSLKVIGSGAKTTIIDGGAKGTVVTIHGANVTLSKLTIRNGFPRDEGGGISNNSTLTINNSSISGNSVFGTHDSYGGGIYNTGTLTINNSTVSGNSAGSYYGYAYGGGIYSSGVTVSNSTISGNSAKGKRGYSGGDIYSGGTATLQNSIVANSTSGGNCSGTMTSNGYNLSSDNTCNFNGPGDLNNTDPKLGTLGNYGGPTPTIPLLSGSPAIDAGNPSGCTDGNGHLLKTDQRGKPRHDKEDTGGCDMGAYERQKD